MDAPAKLSTEITLPFAEEDKQYAEACKKRSLLKKKRNELDSRIGALRTAIAVAVSPLDREEFNTQVAQALASKDGSFERTLDIASARLELSQLEVDIKVVGAAYARQSEIVSEIRAEISQVARKQITSEHQRAVAAIGQAMDDLREAALREKAVHRKLSQAGYEDQLPSFHVPTGINYYGTNWGTSDFYGRVTEYLK